MKPVASMSAHLFLRLCGIALLLTLAYFGGQGVARISDGSAALPWERWGMSAAAHRL